MERSRLKFVVLLMLVGCMPSLPRYEQAIEMSILEDSTRADSTGQVNIHITIVNRGESPVELPMTDSAFQVWQESMDTTIIASPSQPPVFGHVHKLSLAEVVLNPADSFTFALSFACPQVKGDEANVDAHFAILYRGKIVGPDRSVEHAFWSRAPVVVKR